MFKNEVTQYVIVKQYDNQLKIDTKIIKNNKTIRTESSSFISENKISADAHSKLNILQKNISKTYIISVCESLEQKVVEIEQFYQQSENIYNKYKLKNLSSHYSIAILKQDLEKKQRYFDGIGVDYIFSPFNVLYSHIMQNNAKSNSLNIFIFNNVAYLLILNNEKRIVYSDIKSLTAFNKVNDKNFSNDKLEDQKLFDEIHSLEIQTLITDTLNQFYKNNKDEIFCEHISLFYTIKQLTNKQLDIIKEAIMLDFEYLKLNINEHLFDMSKSNHAIKMSFIAPREKKSKKPFVIWLFNVTITFMLAFGIFLYIQNVQQKEQEEKLKKEQQARILAQKKAEANKIKLPNHIAQNEQIIQQLLSVFDIIPYSVVLSELQLEKKNLTFVCSLLHKEIFDKELKPKLLKLYNKSEILLIQDKKPTFDAIIANNHLIQQKSSNKSSKQLRYKNNKFITKKAIKEQLKVFLPKNSIVTFKSRHKLKYLTYNFNITAILKEPKDFFHFIEEINKKPYSIVVKYPIEFAKTKKGLEVIFSIAFNQLYKKKN
jgi:predicted DNA-binding protein